MNHCWIANKSDEFSTKNEQKVAQIILMIFCLRVAFSFKFFHSFVRNSNVWVPGTCMACIHGIHNLSNSHLFEICKSFNWKPCIRGQLAWHFSLCETDCKLLSEWLNYSSQWACFFTLSISLHVRLYAFVHSFIHFISSHPYEFLALLFRMYKSCCVCIVLLTLFIISKNFTKIMCCCLVQIVCVCVWMATNESIKKFIQYKTADILLSHICALHFSLLKGK